MQLIQRRDHYDNSGWKNWELKRSSDMHNAPSVIISQTMVSKWERERKTERERQKETMREMSVTEVSRELGWERDNGRETGGTGGRK